MKKYFFSLVAVLVLSTGIVFSQSNLFFDDFESGTSQWELTGLWGLTSGFSYSPSHSLTDSPDSYYGSDYTAYAAMLTGVDLSACLSASLVFRAIYELESDYDYVYVQVSDDDFITYEELGALSGEYYLTDTTTWIEYVYSLGAYAGKSNVKVRFLFFSDPYVEFDGIYLDDVTIVDYTYDNQPPVVQLTPPQFYQGSLGPFFEIANIIDVSGLSETYLSFSVDGVVQAMNVPANPLGDDFFQFEIPEQLAGSNVDYWLTAIDNSPLLNQSVTDTFHYISGNHIIYDDSVPEYFMITGPASSAPDNTAWAVRFTVPESAPNIVYALIRNYTEISYPNDLMEIHVWDVDSVGGIGLDLIEPFLVEPEASLTNQDPMTRIDLRPYASQLSNHPGDVYLGYTVPQGSVNILVNYPKVYQRSFLQMPTGWYQSTYYDYFIRLISGSNQRDIAVTRILSPQTGFDHFSGESVNVRIKNKGSAPQSNFPVAYSINGSPPVVDTLTGTINPGDSADFVFSVPADLSAVGDYIFDVYTLLPDDQNTANDHFIDTIVHEQEMYCDVLHYDGDPYTGIGIQGGGTFKVAVRFPASLTYPYTGAILDQLQIRLKYFPSSFILKIWDSGNEVSPGTEIFSQDMSEIISTGWNTFSFNEPLNVSGGDIWIGYQLTHDDGQYPASLDAGPPNPDGCWLQLGGNPWSTTIGNWNIRATFCHAAGLKDVGISGIVSPTSTTTLGPAETVTVTVRNFGLEPQTGIPVSFTINGGIQHNDTIIDTIPPGETYNLTFPVTVDLSNTGDYNFDVFTSHADDTNPYNDHFNTVITHISFTECDTLHYDGAHQVNMGLTNGGTFKIAARFQSDIVNSVIGGNVEELLVYIGDLPSSCIIKIWAETGALSPGPELLSQDVTSQLLANSWNLILLNTAIPLTSSGFWAGFQLIHASGKKPVGCDGGNSNTNGNWWCMSGGSWSHPPGYTTFGNWNIRAVVCPAEEPGSIVEGDVIYANNNSTKIENALVYLKSGNEVIKQTLSDVNGHYIFTEVMPGNYTLTAGSDHPWGGVNAVDGLNVLRHFVGLSLLTGIQAVAADVTLDGNINSLDGLSIVRRFVGLISSFPAGDWIFTQVPLTISGNNTIQQDIIGICTGDTDSSYIP
ncbi:MAG: CARDB domain-containing protein [Bacteroidales bacterium]